MATATTNDNHVVIPLEAMKSNVLASGGSDAASNNTQQKNDAKTLINNKRYSFFQLFRYASPLDIALMSVGAAFAVAHGFAFPMALYLFYSQIVNSAMTYSPCFVDIRKNITAIVTAQQNNSLANLPPDLLAFMNSSEYSQVSSYKALFKGEDYSLFADIAPNAGYYALIGIGAFIFACSDILCWTIAGQRQLSRIRCQLFRALLSQDASWFDSHRIGEMNNLIFEMTKKIEGCLSPSIPIFISTLTTCIVGYTIAFVTNWLITLVILSLAPLLYISVFLMIRFVAAYSVKATEAYALAGSIATEVLTNIRTVLIFNRQDYEVNRYADHLGKSQRMTTFKVMSTGTSQAFSLVLKCAMSALSFWWGTSSQVHEPGGNINQISVTVIICTVILAASTPYLERVAEAIGAAREIFRIIDNEPLIDNFQEDKEGSSPQLRGDVEFTDVTFAYPSAPEKLVLRSFSLNIEHGQTVALVGPSGSGKSTLAQLLFKYYEISGGTIKIDGKDIREMNVRDLRRHMGYVGQEPILFNTTIKENICIGTSDPTKVTDTEIIVASKLANAHDFISSLPKGYDTEVGEGGAQLSGGQKQRIAIARTLISNPSILILDEATSALDGTSEKLVQEAIERASVGRTTIIIAHRLSTIRKADLIAVVDDGEVTELGNHQTLICRNGFYCHLVKTQETFETFVDRRRKSVFDVRNERRLSDIKNLDRHRPSIYRLKSGELVATSSFEAIPSDLMPFKKYSYFELLSAVLKWGKPELPLTIICAFATILFMSSEIGGGILLAQSMNTFCPGGSSRDKLLVFIALLVALGFFQFIVMVAQYYLFATISLRLTTRMRRVILGKFFKMDAAWLDCPENQPSLLANILSTDCVDIQGVKRCLELGGSPSMRMQRDPLPRKDQRHRRLLLKIKGSTPDTPSPLLSGVRICIFLAGATIFGFALGYSLSSEYRVALAIIGLMPFMLIGLMFPSLLNKAKDEQHLSDSSRRIATISMDALSNMKTVMSLGAELHFLKKFTQKQNEITKLSIKRGINSAIFLPFSWEFPIWVGAIAYALGSWLIERGQSTFLDVMTVYIILPFCASAIERISSAVPDEGKAKIAAQKLLAIMTESPSIDVEDREPGVVLTNQGASKIEFKEVSFSYPMRPGIHVLKDVNFVIEPGQHVAICGLSGCGKSSIMHLIQRLYDPDCGYVLIDDVDVRKLDLRAFRDRIGIVSQEPALFALSVTKNIAYGWKGNGSGPSALEIDNVCLQANAHEFLNDLPGGLDTEVGERGAQLSGGQKQRIAIARALIRNPKILLLDEATSALDTENERVVQDALDLASRGRTTLTIAHRLSTIQNSDKILVLSNGSIVEQGTHVELMCIKGVYHKLQQAQRSNDL